LLRLKLPLYRAFFAIDAAFDDRYGTRSTLVTSQLPVEHWHESIGDPTLADAILDRLVHNAHRIALKGKSKRKREYPALGSDDGTAATGG